MAKPKATVYTYRCTTCGKVGLAILKLRDTHDVEVVHTSVDEDRLSEHENALSIAGVTNTRWQPVIVYEDGSVRMLL